MENTNWVEEAIKAGIPGDIIWKALEPRISNNISIIEFGKKRTGKIIKFKRIRVGEDWQKCLQMEKIENIPRRA